VVGAGYSKVTDEETVVTVAATWNGTSWKEQSTPRESEIAPNWLAGVSCVGAEGCIAVGHSKASDNYSALLETREEAITSSHLLSFGSEGSGGGKLLHPQGVATDASGNVWVVDQGNDRIEEFNPKGEWVLVFGKEVNKTKVESSGTEAEKNLCTAASGNVCQAGKAGSANGQLSEPQGIAFTSAGNMWVTEEGNDRLQEFNTKGEYLAKFGSEGYEHGKFYGPSGIAIASNGNIWVSDSLYARVDEFNSSGGYILSVGATEYFGNGATEFFYPMGLAIDSNGDVWVVDEDNHNVQELSSTGGYISKYGIAGSGEGQFGEPLGIAIKPSGNAVIAERSANRAQVFTPTGEYLAHFGPAYEPGGVTLGPNGTEYFSVRSLDRVEKWIAPTAPSVTTKPASGLTETGATLKGTVNPEGDETKYYFQYGTTESYGSTTAEASAGSGTSGVEESKSVTGLSADTTYHFRIVATNGTETTYGVDQVLTTFGTWSAQSMPSPEGAESTQLQAVSCSSSTSCTAVGEYRTSVSKSLTLAERWNGTAWTIQSTPNPEGATENPLLGVSCPSSTECIAVGAARKGGTYSPLVERWNGTTWSIQTIAEEGTILRSVSCTSSTSCTAAGESGADGLAEHWNGTSWSAQSVPSPAGAVFVELEGVSCVSSTWCTAVGRYQAEKSGNPATLAEHWNGTSWAVQSMPTETGGSNLLGVSCFSSSVCSAVGYATKMLADYWNGTEWSIQSTPTPNEGKLEAVSCSSAITCVSVGNDGLTQAERWTGTEWVIQSTPTVKEYTYMDGVSCPSVTACTAVGFSGGKPYGLIYN
jgi:sugar lactone lactonase YvrE